jgi:NAD(P)-dependent dehydrogenase (short-subunit alcohol dehydrogenase family)
MSEISKIALITGANKGIGFEIARQLGAQGITILAGVRDRARGETTVQKHQWLLQPFQPMDQLVAFLEKMGRSPGKCQCQTAAHSSDSENK